MTSTSTSKTKASEADLLRSSEIVDDLTGFDEQAIKAHFGATITELGDTDGITFLRACLFAHYRHSGDGGKTDVDKFKSAQGMRFGDLKALFAADDGDDELPGAEGKDGDAT